MLSCSILGQDDCRGLSARKIREILEDLIVNWNIDTFYVSNEGLFDAAVHWTLYDLRKTYSKIKCAVVMPYVPKALGTNCQDVLVPEGIENVDPRKAHQWRNSWMIKKSDFIFAYFPDSPECFLQYSAEVERRQKTIINITA